MNKTVLILRHEIVSLISRFSFWFAVLGLPVTSLLFFGTIDLINSSQRSPISEQDMSQGPAEIWTQVPLEKAPLNFAEIESQVEQVFTEEKDERPQGFVDLSGLVKAFPTEISQEELIPYDQEEEARQALEAGELSAYFVIPQDYIETGQVLVYSEDYNLFDTAMRSYNISYLLSYNLLEGDGELARAAMDPIGEIEYEITGKDESMERVSNPWDLLVPYGVMLLTSSSIMGSASLLLNSIGKERENRVMEVLLASAESMQILLGKVIGLGLVGLLQMVIWMLSLLVTLGLGTRNFSIPDSVQMQPSLVAWGVAFYILGYLMYACLMAGIGALVPNLREASQISVVVILPLIVPVFTLPLMLTQPNHVLVILMSLFPLTSPTGMVMRMATTEVPLWQILAAAAGLVLTLLLVIRLVDRIFHAHRLVSGQSLKIKEFFMRLIRKKVTTQPPSQGVG